MTEGSPATLVGLDFGTTTSSCLVGQARVRRGAVTGRMELSDLVETFRSPLVPTPLSGERLDLEGTCRLLDGWLAAGGVDRERLLGGGALLTGLSARRDNAAGLVAAVRERLGGALVATADDPRLESWVAFQGACAALSRQHADAWFLHADIGGGTANLALGRAGEVHATGCLFVGARHVRLEPGSRRIVDLSPYGRVLLERLSIAAAPGDTLTEEEVGRIVGETLAVLESALAGGSAPAALVDVPFDAGLPPEALASAALTLSGGVGELVYDALAGRALPGTSAFGDVGVDLARGLIAHPRLGPRLSAWRPAAGGRATVIGLLRHAVRLSGTSLHLPDPVVLPLADLPIVGTFVPAADDDGALCRLLDLARRGRAGGALRILGCGPGSAAVTACGARLARVLRTTPWPAGRPLVLLLDTDAGKALGACATAWGTITVPLVAIDRLDLPDARFASLGAPRDGAVPVSFHGLRS